MPATAPLPSMFPHGSEGSGIAKHIGARLVVPEQESGVLWFAVLCLFHQVVFINDHTAFFQAVFNCRYEGTVQVVEADDEIVGILCNRVVASLQVCYMRVYCDNCCSLRYRGLSVRFGGICLRLLPQILRRKIQGVPAAPHGNCPKLSPLEAA
jgi:hypothetical protein